MRPTLLLSVFCAAVLSGTVGRATDVVAYIGEGREPSIVSQPIWNLADLERLLQPQGTHGVVSPALRTSESLWAGAFAPDKRDTIAIDAGVAGNQRRDNPWIGSVVRDGPLNLQFLLAAVVRGQVAMAEINGRFVGVGTVVDGWKLLDLTDREGLLEKEGVRIRVPLAHVVTIRDSR